MPSPTRKAAPAKKTAAPADTSTTTITILNNPTGLSARSSFRIEQQGISDVFIKIDAEGDLLLSEDEDFDYGTVVSIEKSRIPALLAAIHKLSL